MSKNDRYAIDDSWFLFVRIGFTLCMWGCQLAHGRLMTQGQINIDKWVNIYRSS